MNIQYSCKNPKRRQLVRDSLLNLNGIDYIEVLDKGTSEDMRQRQIEIYFLKEYGIDALQTGNIRIEGGERIKNIQVIGLDYGSPPDKKITVTLNHWGDFSTYRLKLIDKSKPDDPPAGFDPILSEVDFSFKIDCPSDFDCKPELICLPEMGKSPMIDYLAKDYASFRRLMLDRLAVTMPDWKERNAADVNIALVEVLAYAADYLSYYQDAVATEAYLGTARKRASVRRHARLLDYHMHEGCNARCWVSIEVDDDIKPAPGENEVLPRGARLLTKIDMGAVIHPDRLNEALAKQPIVFETMSPVLDLRVKRSKINFYTWGDNRCCLPKGATTATLEGSLEELGLKKGDVLIFEEVAGTNGLPADADPDHRHAVRLSKEPVEKVDPLYEIKVVDIEWHSEDAPPFPLCLWQIDNGKGGVVHVSIARGNVVLADHGLTFDFRTFKRFNPVTGEQDRGLNPSEVPFEGIYRPYLSDTGITYRELYDEDKMKDISAATAIKQNPSLALPAVTLFDRGEEWNAQKELLNSGRFANEFVVETEEDGRAYLRFGDGIMGKLPAEGMDFTASYRVGNGRIGNIGAKAISHIVATYRNGILAVSNPIAARGGTDPEQMEHVKLYAPAAFKKQKRAVTESDYAWAAEQHAEVQKAMATRRWTGSWYTYFITVDRRGGLEVSQEFEQRLRNHLEAYRLAGYDLEIDGPSFVSLDIAFTVCVKQGYYAADVKQALVEVFSHHDLRVGRRGFFHPDNFTFGQPVYLSRLISTAMNVPGVQWVDIAWTNERLNRFQRWGEDTDDHIKSGQIEMGRLEIARLDNDPNAPENGRIDFIMVGGA